MSTVQYVVKDEHTLGYLQEGSDLMGVLRGSVKLGGHDWMDGPVPMTGSTIRPATEADFEFFRVELPSDFGEGLND